MHVKFKKLHENAVLPKYANEGDAGLDLVAVDDGSNTSGIDGYKEYRTGLAVEIPEGYVGLLFPRSSITNKDLMLKNSVGIIDSSYRGEVRMRFHTLETNSFMGPNQYRKGERIGQLLIMPIPHITPVMVPELPDSPRGQGGFGSTGK